MRHIYTPVITVVTLTIPIMIFSVMALFMLYTTVQNFIIVIGCGCVIGFVVLLLDKTVATEYNISQGILWAFLVIFSQSVALLSSGSISEALIRLIAVDLCWLLAVTMSIMRGDKDV